MSNNEKTQLNLILTNDLKSEIDLTLTSNEILLSIYDRNRNQFINDAIKHFLNVIKQERSITLGSTLLTFKIAPYELEVLINFCEKNNISFEQAFHEYIAFINPRNRMLFDNYYLGKSAEFYKESKGGKK